MCRQPDSFAGSRREHPPILCYVTDRRSLRVASSENQQTLLSIIASAGESGVDWIQLREKDLSAKELAALTRETIQRVRNFHTEPATATNLASPPRILLNDRLDVALTENTGGVHLGENSLPVDTVKQLLQRSSVTLPIQPRDFLVGASCHSLESAKSAASAGADYLVFGPVFATPSKQAFGAPQGLNCLETVCRSVAVPVLAIGGITLENAANCFKAGAAGLAAIRLFQDATDIKAVVRLLRKLASASVLSLKFATEFTVQNRQDMA